MKIKKALFRIETVTLSLGCFLIALFSLEVATGFDYFSVNFVIMMERLHVYETGYVLFLIGAITLFVNLIVGNRKYWWLRSLAMVASIFLSYISFVTIASV